MLDAALTKPSYRGFASEKLKQGGIVDLTYGIEEKDLLLTQIGNLTAKLGQGKTSSVAYDTAWVARLNRHYSSPMLQDALQWLRQHQHADGTWGASTVHYHDRFISTLAAIVALREVGDEKRDERRVKRGENALWKLVGHLSKDDSDTIGFPILAASLAQEATNLGLDVPLPPIRYAEAYKGKVQALLNHPKRQWRSTTLSFSLEALRYAVHDGDEVLEDNHSVAVSPAATAAYLLIQSDERAMTYLEEIQGWNQDGAFADVGPVDIFDISWSIIHLGNANAIHPDDPAVRRALDYLWQHWSDEVGIGHSSYFGVPDIDDTAATFTALKWGGYPVNADVFSYYETDTHFSCFLGETNPALSAHVRLLSALRLCEDHPKYEQWVNKTVSVLRRLDENGSFWWDKWHASPYYVNSAAFTALHNVADDLLISRYRWIVRTQNDDGGWGYFGYSTPEETAYCLEALLYWDRKVDQVDPQILKSAAQYLQKHLNDSEYAPLWIGKCLYTPHNPVRAAILGALYGYINLKGE